MNAFVDYKDIFFLKAQMDFDGNVTLKVGHYAKGFTRGKMMYLSYDYVRPHYMFQKATEHTTVNTNDVLYISPSSSISRDLIRKTGYKITYNKENADKIVVPQTYDPATFTTNLVVEARDADIALVVDTYRTSNFVKESFDSAEVALFEAAIKEWYLKRFKASTLIFHKKDDELDDFVIYFLKRCEEYKDMYGSNGKYVSDVKLPINASYTTDLDSIEVMIRCKDSHILDKMLQGSDWQNYPLTTCMVLDLTQGYVSRTEATSLFLRAIDYDTFRYDSPIEWGKNRIISPEDWNLAQRMVMRKLHLDEEKGGFINPSSSVFDSDQLRWLGWCMRRVYVKPHYITEPTPFSDLWSLLKIS